MDQLAKVRAEIDQIDTQLLALFTTRMQLATQAAHIKQNMSMPLVQPNREQQILDRIAQLAAPELSSYVCRYFQTIITLSKEYQASLKNVDQEAD